MRNKLFVTLLTLCMALALMPGTALASDITTDEPETSTELTGSWQDKVNWHYDADTQTLTISSNGTVTELKAPDASFTYKESVKEIQFSTDDEIKFSALVGCFAGFTRLEQIEIPAEVTKIGNDTFKNCSSLTEINLPAGVDVVSDHFAGCTSLTAINVGTTSEENSEGNQKYYSDNGLLFHYGNNNEKELFRCPEVRRVLFLSLTV